MNGVDGKISRILSKIIESRNFGFKQTEIVRIWQEFIKISKEFDNTFSNTKYVITSMLRTHKDELYKYIQTTETKNIDELLKVRNLLFKYIDFWYKQIISE